MIRCNRLPASPRGGPARRSARVAGGAPPMTSAEPNLLRRAVAPDADGLVCAVDPASAGWDWTTFHVYRLAPGRSITRPADDLERLVLVLEGYAALTAGDEAYGVTGSRMSVFDGPPCPVLL